MPYTYLYPTEIERGRRPRDFRLHNLLSEVRQKTGEDWIVLESKYIETIRKPFWRKEILEHTVYRAARVTPGTTEVFIVNLSINGGQSSVFGKSTNSFDDVMNFFHGMSCALNDKTIASK